MQLINRNNNNNNSNGGDNYDAENGENRQFHENGDGGGDDEETRSGGAGGDDTTSANGGGGRSSSLLFDFSNNNEMMRLNGTTPATLRKKRKVNPDKDKYIQEPQYVTKRTSSGRLVKMKIINDYDYTSDQEQEGARKKKSKLSFHNKILDLRDCEMKWLTFSAVYIWFIKILFIYGRLVFEKRADI